MNHELYIMIRSLTKTKLSLIVIKQSTDKILCHEVIEVDALTRTIGNYISLQVDLDRNVTLPPISEE